MLPGLLIIGLGLGPYAVGLISDRNGGDHQGEPPESLAAVADRVLLVNRQFGQRALLRGLRKARLVLVHELGALNPIARVGSGADIGVVMLLVAPIGAAAGVRPAVLIADSFGRPWRIGQVDAAIGVAAGMGIAR